MAEVEIELAPRLGVVRKHLRDNIGFSAKLNRELT